jgi:hypothetical protein
MVSRSVQPVMNDFLELGKPIWIKVRNAVQSMLAQLDTTESAGATLPAGYLKCQVCNLQRE